jgi:hypothetical protein
VNANYIHWDLSLLHRYQTGDKMDTNGLIIMSMGVPLIAIGLPLLAIARYLLAPEDKKTQIARRIERIAIAWVVAGLMIYLLAIILRFVLKSV